MSVDGFADFVIVRCGGIGVGTSVNVNGSLNHKAPQAVFIDAW
jgi:hypothetical protein